MQDWPRTLLLTFCVSSPQGGSKIQEASYIFQELSDKFSMTVPLMNGSALCHMHMGRYDDAESLLLEALNKVRRRVANGTLMCRCYAWLLNQC